MFLHFRGKRLFGLLVLLLGLIWPAIWNSGPFYFSDTPGYIRRADDAIHAISGLVTPWTRSRHSVDSIPSNTGGEVGAGFGPTQGVRVSPPPPERGAHFSGRSIYYGMLLYVGVADRSFWVTILLQGAAVLLVLWLLLRLQEMSVWPAILLIGLPLCFISDVSFFASFLMPDLFAGIAILTCAALFATERTLRASEATVAYLLIAVGLLFHGSIPPVIMVLVVCYYAWIVLHRSQFIWRQNQLVTWLLLAAFITWTLGSHAYGRAVTNVTGNPPVRLPFLSAHLIEGPGAAFLRATCPRNGFLLCDYADRFPEPSWVFLWSTSKKEGAVLHSPEMSPALTRRLCSEDLRFAVAVFQYAPLDFLEFIGRDVTRQTVNFSLREFFYTPNHKRLLDNSLPAETRANLDKSRAYTESLPIGVLSTLNNLSVLGSLVFLVVYWIVNRHRAARGDHRWKLTVWIIAGVVINAVICGAIAGGAARYQARVVWLLPLTALLAAIGGLAKRDCKTHPSYPGQDSLGGHVS